MDLGEVVVTTTGIVAIVALRLRTAAGVATHDQDHTPHVSKERKVPPTMLHP